MTLETKNPARPCTLEDLFTPAPDAPAELLEAVRLYLKPFAAPVVRERATFCLSCDGRVDCMAQLIGFGVAYRWGLAHGEANCTGCGWPARGFHVIRDASGAEVAQIRNVFLAYHPDVVERAREAEARDDAQAEHEALELQSTGRL